MSDPDKYRFRIIPAMLTFFLRTTYRSREEIQKMRSTNDPITGLKARLIDWSVMAESDLKQLDKSAREEVDQAVEEAKQSPEPDPVKDLWTDVYFKYVFLVLKKER
jgi:pyruvate dehydrogenase E1 component alpha subunit